MIAQSYESRIRIRLRLVVLVPHALYLQFLLVVCYRDPSWYALLSHLWLPIFLQTATVHIWVYWYKTPESSDL